MVWSTIKSALGMAEPTLPDGPTRLPPYFPVQPPACAKHSEKLFACLANEATQKARDMERAGLHTSYFEDVTVQPVDAVAAETVAREGEDRADLPKATDNPLDECRTFVAYYQRCCDRELKKKKNWILNEHVRVQEEYRYKGPVKEEAGAK
mmetsp:Transcript_11437/g.31671  ORF Transcript_11437/g.31671 Transcript_11437/m.31671 type:complete len:151 (+) Transcript_11437:111-563(+)